MGMLVIIEAIVIKIIMMHRKIVAKVVNRMDLEPDTN
jgi:hypothetical protein